MKSFSVNNRLCAVSFVFLSIIIGGIGILRCGRDNPLDPHGNKYLLGSAPAARFLEDTIRAFVKDTVPIPVSYHDTAAIGGRTPQVRMVYFNWQGDSTSLKDSSAVPAGDTVDSIVRSFRDTCNVTAYMRAVDNDSMYSPVTSARLIVLLGAPRIKLLTFSKKIYPDDKDSITAYGTDTNGSVESYRWWVNNSRDSTITARGSFVVSFPAAGRHVVYVKAIDDDTIPSLLDSAVITVMPRPSTADSTGPVVSFQTPAKDTLGIPNVTVRVWASDPSGVSSVIINSETASNIGFLGSSSLWQLSSLHLNEGKDTIIVLATDNNSLHPNMSETKKYVFYDKNMQDSTPPAITLLSPQDSQTVNKSTISVRVDVVDESGAGVDYVKCNNDTMKLQSGTTYTVDESLALGMNKFVVTAWNRKGISSSDTFFVTYSTAATTDTIQPLVQIMEPKSGQQVASKLDTIRVHASDDNTGNSGIASVTINGVNANLVDQYNNIWEGVVSLTHGNNMIRVTATDSSKNSKMDSVAVVQNGAPVFSDSTRDTALVVGKTASLMACASDPDNDLLNFALTDPIPSSTSTLQLTQTSTCLTINNYTPSDTGTVIFRIRAADGYGGSGTCMFKVIVTPPHPTKPYFTTDTNTLLDSAIAGRPAQPYKVQINATDPNQKKLTYSLGSPAGATISDSGKVTWYPAYSDTGKKVFVAYASNGTESASLRWTVRVIMPDIAPVLAHTADTFVNEGQLLKITLVAADSNNDYLTYSMTGIPSGARLSGNVFTWTPDYSQGQATPYKVLFRVQEQNRVSPLFDTHTVKITVKNVDRPPVMQNPGSQTVNEMDTLRFKLSATDPDGDSLGFSFGATYPQGAQIVGSQFIWVPTYHDAGTYSVVLKATEKNMSPALSDSTTISIIVKNVNVPPVMQNPGNQTVNEQRQLSFPLNAADVNGDSILFSIRPSAPAGASITTGQGKPAFSWTPSGQQAGTYLIMFYATDNGQPAMRDSQTIAVTVLDTTVPVFKTLAAQMEDSIFVGSMYRDTVSATDADGDAPVYKKLTGPLWLSVDSSTGIVSGKPASTDVGNNISVSLTAQDQAGNKDTLSWKLAVVPMWPRTWGGAATGDTGYSIIHAANGFAVCGVLASTVSDAKSGFFIKTDEQGNPSVFKTYGSKAGYGLYSIAQASDGGYVMCGSDSSSVSKLLLVKIDTAGDTMWVGRFTSSVGAISSARGASVCATRDGGFAACGTGFRRGTTATSAVYMVKTNSAGVVEWDQEYTTPVRGNSSGYCVQQTSDDGFIICGTMATAGSTAGGTNFYLIKTNSSGDTAWTQVYNSRTVRDAAVSVLPVADGYIVGGYSAGQTANSTSGVIFKVGQTGDSVWTLALSNAGGSTAITSVKPAGDGNFIASGFAVNLIGGEDALLFKFSPDGKEVWRKMYGGTLNDRAYSVAPVAADNGFALTGFTTTSTSADIYTVRTDANGILIQN